MTARPDWDLVVSLGGRTPLPDLGAVPSNVHLLPWVPQLEVLRHADVAVVHGGIGTVEECIASRVPMLVYCGFETDMGGNAARVWHHGVGVVGDPRDSPEKIRARIDHLLSDSRFATNLARLSAHHAAYTENRVAEGIIQSLVAP